MVASNWRRRVLAACRFGVAAAATAAMLVVAPGRAADISSMYCPIARAPSLGAMGLAQSDACSLDEDGNGLDDEVERELARCFVPTVAFDSEEDALLPDEPRVVFSASLVGSNVFRFRYVFLFSRDSGYVLGATFPCMKYDHNGDAQAVDVDVTWMERDHRWFGAPVGFHADTVDRLAGISSALRPWERVAFSGSHPILYATAGKHHWAYREASLAYGCDCGPLGRCGSVRDRADGRGARVTPILVHHAPGFYRHRSEAHSLATAGHHARPQSPMIDEGRRFSNACEYRRSGRIVPASGAIITNDLATLGYAGERVHGSCFRGGLGGPCAYTTSVADALAWEAPFASYSLDAGKLVAWLLGAPGAKASSDDRRDTGIDRFVSPRKPVIPVGVHSVAGTSRLFIRLLEQVRDVPRSR